MLPTATSNFSAVHICCNHAIRGLSRGMQQETSIRQPNGRNIEAPSADRKCRSSLLDTATILPEDQTMLSLCQIFTWNRRTFTCKIRHPPALRCKKLQHRPFATCDLFSRLCFFINDISALSTSGFTCVMSF